MKQPGMQKEIIRAAKKGDATAIMSLLKSEKSLLNARDVDGGTPLHCAAWKGHAEVAELLLDAGADVNARSNNTHYGDTPLHAAAHGNQKMVAQVLIARGADLNAKNPEGRTPLGETTIHNATAVAKLLRERGAK